jgi:VanZ family protein
MKNLSYWFPVLLWMGIIFTFSSFESIPAVEVYWLDFAIKKTAHMIEYGILWYLIFRALSKTSSISLKSAAYLSLFIIILYAATDEWHQTMVPGRHGKLRDVLIDTAGASLAFGFVWFNKSHWITGTKKGDIDLNAL